MFCDFAPYSPFEAQFPLSVEELGTLVAEMGSFEVVNEGFTGALVPLEWL